MKSTKREMLDHDCIVDEDWNSIISIKLPYDTKQIKNCILTDKGKVWTHDLHRFNVKLNDCQSTKMKWSACSKNEIKLEKRDKRPSLLSSTKYPNSRSVTSNRCIRNVQISFKLVVELRKISSKDILRDLNA